MIIYNKKRIATCSAFPDSDFMGDANWVIPDDSELAQKIMGLFPNFEIIFDDDGQPVDAIKTEPVPAPPASPTNAELAAAIAELAEVICGG